MMIICRIRGKIIRTVLCYVVCDSCAHACEQFLKFNVGLGLGLIAFCVFFCFILDHFVRVV